MRYETRTIAIPDRTWTTRMAEPDEVPRRGGWRLGAGEIIHFPDDLEGHFETVVFPDGTRYITVTPLAD